MGAFWKFRNEDKVVSKFKKLLDTKIVAYIAAGGFDEKLEKGFAEDISAQSYKPLTAKYIRWKVKRGYDARAWVKTGKLMRSLQHNVISKVGYNKGITYEFSSRGMATVYPTVLMRYLGTQKSGGTDQGKVYGKYGQMNKRRPLFFWKDSDMPKIEAGVAKRFEKFLAGEGFAVKVKGKVL